MFDVAKAKELSGLLEGGVYELVCKEDAQKDADVQGGPSVLDIKYIGAKQEVYKARFMLQGHTDAEKNIIVHNSTN